MTSITFLPSIGNLPNKTTAQQLVSTALQAIDSMHYKRQVALQATDILLILDCELALQATDSLPSDKARV